MSSVFPPAYADLGDDLPTDRQVAQLRIPPHSLEAESSVLGGLLLDNNAWDRVGDLLKDGDFGLLTLLSDLQECSPTSFKRLHEGLNLKAFKTSEGFISIKAGISLVGLDAQSLPTTPQTLLDRASDLLPDACSSGRINAVRLPKAQ